MIELESAEKRTGKRTYNKSNKIEKRSEKKEEERKEGIAGIELKDLLIKLELEPHIIHDKDFMGYNLIQQVIKAKRNDIFFVILNFYDLSEIKTSLDGMNILHFAISNDNEEIAKYLTSIIDVSQRNKHGNLPIHFAVNESHYELIDILIEKGNDINDDQNKWKLSPLHIACRKANRAMVKFLLERGASLKSLDHLGNTPGEYYSIGGILQSKKDKAKKLKMAEKARIKEEKDRIKQEKMMAKEEKRKAKEEKRKIKEEKAMMKLNENGELVPRKRGRKPKPKPQLIEIDIFNI